MNELLEIYLEASGGKYGDQKGIFAVRDHVVAEMKAKLDRAERALKRAGYQDLGAQEWKPPLGLSVQAIRNAWLDAEVVGNSWDGAKAVLDLYLSGKRSVDEKCPKCFDTGTIMMVGGPPQACDCNMKISTGKAFQMEPGTMTQDEALGVIMANLDQVEALARVLHKSQDAFYCRYGDHATKFDDHAPLWRTMSRAAIAHLAKRPEVSTKPVDLWAVITSIVDVRVDCDGCDYVEIDRTSVSDLEVALSPWLRDPVEFELDVTEEEWADKCREFWTISVKTKDAFDLELKDFIKSRIKPVYECDCSAIEKERDLLKVEYESRQIMINNVWAALEGRPFKNTLEGE